MYFVVNFSCALSHSFKRKTMKAASLSALIKALRAPGLQMGDIISVEDVNGNLRAYKAHNKLHFSRFKGVA